MRYIIMCGGNYTQWETPRQLIEINGEPIVARTIRLLRKYGVTDIAITSENPAFEQFGVPVLHHDNPWEVYGHDDVSGTWVTCFYPMSEPACYLLGDVVFSENAIQTIINTPTDDIEFFASAPPFASEYNKEYAEPFAFKVVNQKHFRECIDDVKYYESIGKFNRPPIAWELWQVIKNTPLNNIIFTNYTAINDYTCDIDWADEANEFLPYIEEEIIKEN